ncbi:MAG: stage II sporulation protein R [Clostridium sp.]|nr:stage II sporulation protein R [Clostridium sp.]
MVMIVFLTSITVLAGILISSPKDVSGGIADNLVRLHVLANSDSPEDQQLKRDVKDVVIEYMKSKLEGIGDIESARKIIKENFGRIEEISINEIKRQHYDYDVKVVLGNYPFPTKIYGDIGLPAGKYEALRIVIGKGEGQNWWCVLFPPLCFVDATHGVVPDSAKDSLQEVLTEEEYCLVTVIGMEEEIPIKMEFKVAEMFKDSRTRLNGAVNRFFRLFSKDTE